MSGITLVDALLSMCIFVVGSFILFRFVLPLIIMIGAGCIGVFWAILHLMGNYRQKRKK